MRKISSLMLAICLSLVTLFVFATSPRFLNQGLVVDDGSGGYKQISLDLSLNGLNLETTTAGNEMELTNQSNQQRSVYYFDGSSTYTPVRSDGTW